MKLLNKNNIQNVLNNPIILFGTVTFILTLILLFGCQFQLPDLYTNRELANTIAISVNPDDVYKATRHLHNIKYFIYNNLFHIWSYSIIIFIFSLIFKITQFQKFKNLSFITNRWFVYIWINISYLIGAYCFSICFADDIGNYICTLAPRASGFAIVGLIALLIVFGIYYYIIVNLLAIITYNTKIKKKYYNFLWVIALMLLLVIAYISASMKYSYFHILLDLCYFIWFIFIIYSICLKKNYEK